MLRKSDFQNKNSIGVGVNKFLFHRLLFNKFLKFGVQFEKRGLLFLEKLFRKKYDKRRFFGAKHSLRPISFPCLLNKDLW